MSKETGKKQAAQPHEAERQLSMKESSEVVGKHGGPAITPPSHHHKPPKQAKPRTKGKNPPKASSPAQGKETPKQSAPRTPAGKKRRPAPTGRADGPLARRRRFRIRLLVALLLVVNVAAAVVWRDWAVSLAVLIGSVIVTPLLAAALLRRK